MFIFMFWNWEYLASTQGASEKVAGIRVTVKMGDVGKQANWTGAYATEVIIGNLPPI